MAKRGRDAALWQCREAIDRFTLLPPVPVALVLPSALRRAGFWGLPLGPGRNAAPQTTQQRVL
jgi:hypothetical protein